MVNKDLTPKANISKSPRVQINSASEHYHPDSIAARLRSISHQVANNPDLATMKALLHL